MVSKTTIKNLSRPSSDYAEQVRIGFSYQDAPEDVKLALLELANSVEEILDEPAPLALTLAYDDFAIQYALKFYIKDYRDEIFVKDLLMTKFHSMAQDKGFTIPFPTQQLHIETNKLSEKLS